MDDGKHLPSNQNRENDTLRGRQFLINALLGTSVILTLLDFLILLSGEQNALGSYQKVRHVSLALFYTYTAPIAMIMGLVVAAILIATKAISLKSAKYKISFWGILLLTFLMGCVNILGLLERTAYVDTISRNEKRYFLIEQYEYEFFSSGGGSSYDLCICDSLGFNCDCVAFFYPLSFTNPRFQSSQQDLQIKTDEGLFNLVNRCDRHDFCSYEALAVNE